MMKGEETFKGFDHSYYYQDTLQPQNYIFWHATIITIKEIEHVLFAIPQ